MRKKGKDMLLTLLIYDDIIVLMGMTINNIRKLAIENCKITDIIPVCSEDKKTDALRIIFESSFGENSYIRTALHLPKNWNNRFLGLGNGGMGGSVGNIPPWQYLELGYATACTDMGTSKYLSGEIKKASVELYKDYTYRSTHVMTVVSKEIIKAYYGKEIEFSYFFGASAGGLQAFSEVQRYPEDYDGVLAGVPSNNAINLVVYFLYLYQKLHAKDGTALINKDEAKTINEKAVEFFKKYNLVNGNDNFIAYPYVDENTVVSFINYLRENTNLTDNQLAILKDLYDGPKHSKTGEQLFCGLPIGSEINCGAFADKLNFGYSWFRLFFGDDYNDWDFDFGQYYDKFFEQVGKYFCANNPDVKAFNDRGGKFIVYLGLADPSGPYADGVKYYNRVCDKLGGYNYVSKFFKYFLLPGKGHGAEGLGINKIMGEDASLTLIDTLKKWREEDVAPNYLTCSHVDISNGEEKVKFTRKIYPYANDKKEGRDFPKTTSDRILELCGK